MELPHSSPVNLFIFIQALLQKMIISHQLQLMGGSTLRACDFDNPQSMDGSLPFASISFLALAFVRLHMDLGPYRRLESRDPNMMAVSVISFNVPLTTSKCVGALLFAVHALSLCRYAWGSAMSLAVM